MVIILASNKRWNSAANRFYYACFYIVSAYLVNKNLNPVSHAGLKTTFNKELVKSGKIGTEDGKLFNKLFGIRQEADYEDFIEIDESELIPLIPKIKQLIKEIEKLIATENNH